MALLIAQAAFALVLIYGLLTWLIPMLQAIQTLAV